MILKLVVQSQANCYPLELLLSDSSHGIGRMHDNDLSIQNDWVSGYHAALTQTPEGDYTVNDLDSSNGTFLNGTRISSPERVKVGDFLKLGNFKIAVEEHTESFPVAENESRSEEPFLKIFSLKEDFSLEEEEDGNTFPIAPVRAPLIFGKIDEILKTTARTEESVPAPGEANEEAERAEEVQQVKTEQAQAEQAQAEQAQAEQAQAEQVKAEQVKAEQRKQSADTRLEVFRSNIQTLTSDLDNALKEISRLKAINGRQSSMPDEIAGQVAGAETPRQEIVQDEENAALRSEIIKLQGDLAESERKLLESSQDKARTENKTIFQLRKQIAEIESASQNLEEVEKNLTRENLTLQQQLEAAKIAEQESVEREANLGQKNAELVGKLKNAEDNSALLTIKIEKARASISKNETLIENLQQQLSESEARSETGRKLKAKLESTEQIRLDAEIRVSELEEKLVSIETEAQAVKGQLETSEKTCSELEEELARSITIWEELKSARDDLRIELKHRDKRIADLVESSEKLKFKFQETDKEKAQIHHDLQLTREGLSEALHSTHRRLADANQNLNIEIYLREAAEKQLREAAAALASLDNGPEALALSSQDTNLNRISDLTEEKSAEMLAFEARLEALYPSEEGKDSKEKKPAETGSFPENEFYRQFIERLDLVDSFTTLYANKWRYSKVAQQFAQLKNAFLELLEEYSVCQFDLEPGTSLGMKQKNRFDLAPNDDGTLPKIDPFGNTRVAETVSPGYIFRNGSREVIIRKAKVAVN